MKAKLFILLCCLFAPLLMKAQSGPGLGNLTYSGAESFRSIWKYTTAQHYGSNIAVMHNGYLVTTYTPDSGRPPGGIMVWDVSNPRSPVLVKNIFDTRTSSLREAHSIGQYGNYLAFQDGCGIQIWDFTNPREPVQVKKFCISGYGHDDYGSSWQLFWQAPYIYIGNGSAGLDVVDASDVRNPVYVKHVNVGLQVGPLFAIGNLLVTGAHNTGRGYAILDISDPRNPRVLNTERSGENIYSGFFNGSRMIGSARGNSNNSTFSVFDFSDPLNIKFGGRININNSGEQLYCATQDEYIFQGCQNEIVKINASNLANMTVAGRGNLGISGDSDHGQVTPMGNLVFVGNDHGSGSGFIVHQTAPDTRGPSVNMVSPLLGSTNRALTSRIGMTFTDNVDLRTVNSSTFIVRPKGGSALSGRYSHQFSVVNFTPDQPLLANTTYEIVVPAGGLKDWVGNAIPTTFVSSFSTGASPPPSTGITNLSGVYSVQNRKSGLFLDVDGISTAHGAKLHQWTSNNGGGNQQFRFTHLGGGTYEIRAVHSGKALDIVGASTAEGALLNQWDYNGAFNQQFIVQDAGEGYCRLIAKHSDMALEIGSASTAVGAGVQQWTSNNGSHQQWKLTPATGTPPVATVYKDCDYSAAGYAVGLPTIGDYTLNQLLALGVADNDASSLKVSPGYEVQLFADDNFLGASITLSGETNCLVDRAWNDRASSLKVRRIPPPSVAPTVSFTSPSAGAGFVAPASITFGANAADADGTVSKVEFYHGATLLGTDTSAPYAYTWAGVGPGRYTVTAKATDNAGASASADVTFAVGVATLHKDCNYGGYAVALPAIGSYTLNQLLALGMVDNDASSLRVSPGYEVQLFADDNFLGASITLSGATSCLVDRTWNDRASSLRVRALPAARSTPSAPAEASGSALTIYPNPVTDRLHIRSSHSLTGARFQIVDVAGRVVAAGPAAGGSVDVSRLRAGIYTLRLLREGQVLAAERFVK